jgi:hypothetical protein
VFDQARLLRSSVLEVVSGLWLNSTRGPWVSTSLPSTLEMRRRP